MEIRKYIDLFGDDVYALALIVTKSFDSAKQVFVQTSEKHEKFTDVDGMFPIAGIAYSFCKEADSNDSAYTLSGIELTAKQQSVLELLLQKPQIVRTIIHLFYENDLDEKQIAKVTGESERYVSSQLSELSDEFASALEKYYKEICLKIKVEDTLKAYVISSAEKQTQREFEVKREAVPRHSWTKRQKTVVIIVAVIVTVIICICIPIWEKYKEMMREIGNTSYDEPSTDEIFSYTFEPEENSDEIVV